MTKLAGELGKKGLPVTFFEFYGSHELFLNAILDCCSKDSSKK